MTLRSSLLCCFISFGALHTLNNQHHSALFKTQPLHERSPFMLISTWFYIEKPLDSLPWRHGSISEAVQGENDKKKGYFIFPRIRFSFRSALSSVGDGLTPPTENYNEEIINK